MRTINYILAVMFLGGSSALFGAVFAGYTPSFVAPSFVQSLQKAQVVVSTENVPVPVSPSTILPPRSTSLLFAGDIMLSRGIGTVAKREGDNGYPFDLVRKELTSADVFFANLESPISDQGKNVGSIYSFRADPQMVDSLVSAGVDVVSFANNHVGDYGPSALLDTLARLDAAGIRHAGAGATYDAAHTPAIVETNGLRIAYFAYTNIAPAFYLKSDAEPAVANINIEAVTEDIASAKSAYGADVVVVSYHWGEEYATKHNAWQERIAHATVDAGANLVIGHHPHVVEEVEQYNGGVIAYSLGNFIFDQNFSPDTSNGLVLRVNIKKGAITGVEELPVSFTKTYQPFFR